jgi:Asp-tRNA(Asn)/Glu-tRNA(Gln) amidotransferase B subunit
MRRRYTELFLGGVAMKIQEKFKSIRYFPEPDLPKFPNLMQKEKFK